MNIKKAVLGVGASVSMVAGNALAATSLPEYNGTENTFGAVGTITEDAVAFLAEYGPMLLILGIFFVVLYNMRDTIVSFFSGLMKNIKR